MVTQSGSRHGVDREPLTTGNRAFPRRKAYGRWTCPLVALAKVVGEFSTEPSPPVKATPGRRSRCRRMRPEALQSDNATRGPCGDRTRPTFPQGIASRRHEVQVAATNRCRRRGHPHPGLLHRFVRGSDTERKRVAVRDDIEFVAMIDPEAVRPRGHHQGARCPAEPSAIVAPERPLVLARQRHPPEPEFESFLGGLDADPRGHDEGPGVAARVRRGVITACGLGRGGVRRCIGRRRGLGLREIALRDRLRRGIRRDDFRRGDARLRARGIPWVRRLPQVLRQGPPRQGEDDYPQRGSDVSRRTTDKNRVPLPPFWHGAPLPTPG